MKVENEENWRSSLVKKQQLKKVVKLLNEYELELSRRLLPTAIQRVKKKV